jgi:hypothetical protein
MRFYGERLSRSTFNAHASDAGFRAAVNLWWAAWQAIPAASLPDDEIVLTRLAGLGRDLEKFRELRGEAMHGFIKCTDGRLYHRFLADEAKKSWELLKHNRDRQQRHRDRQMAQARGTDVTVTSPLRDGNVTGKERRGKDRGFQVFTNPEKPDTG